MTSVSAGNLMLQSLPVGPTKSGLTRMNLLVTMVLLINMVQSKNTYEGTEDPNALFERP